MIMEPYSAQSSAVECDSFHFFILHVWCLNCKKKELSFNLDGEIVFYSRTKRQSFLSYKMVALSFLLKFTLLEMMNLMFLIIIMS